MSTNAVGFRVNEEAFEHGEAYLARLERLHRTDPSPQTYAAVVKSIFLTGSRAATVGIYDRSKACLDRLESVVDTEVGPLSKRTDFYEPAVEWVLALATDQDTTDAPAQLISLVKTLLDESSGQRFCGVLVARLDERLTSGALTDDTFQQLASRCT